MPKRILRKRLATFKKNFWKKQKSVLGSLAEEQIARVGSLGQEIVLMQMSR